MNQELPPANTNVLGLHSNKGLKKFEPGHVVFFKRIKETAAPHGRYQEFKGHGFGILIGTVPDRAPDPPIEFVIARMGQLGFVSFDDVGEALGVEAAQKVLAHITKKYYSPAPPKLAVLTDPAPPT